ncbi:N/A [soil metagenome]
MASLEGLANRFRGLVFRICERVLPARSDHWCFCTWPGAYPHTLDNPRAVFEEVKDDASIVKIILVRRPLDECNPSMLEGTRVLLVHAETLRAVYYLAVSRVVLLGYGIGGMTSYSRFLTTKHSIVQLWHGIPLKRIGKLFPGEPWWDAETRKYAATVCSSARDGAIMAQAFAPIPPDRVWQTGLPRHDLITRQEAALPTDYREQLVVLRARLAGRRLVLYAPTWRERGAGMYEFTPEEQGLLSTVLAAEGAVLGIRGHSNVRSKLPDDDQPAADRIIYLNDFPDVNVVLRLTDVLITDYSSLYIDFLPLRRPILHFTYDIDTYVTERGFLYALDDALASVPFRTFPDLLARLTDALQKQDIDPTRHAQAMRLFHDHGDRPALDVAKRIRQLAGASAR